MNPINPIKGIITTGMTTPDREGISSPATGLVIYNSITGKFIFYNGSARTAMGSGGGISTLNTLTASTRTFAAGTTGTDFNISSVTSTHTFNN